MMSVASTRLEARDRMLLRTRRVRWFASISVLAVLVGITGTGVPQASTVGDLAGRNRSSHPNIVVIMTDDQDVASVAFMSNVQALLSDHGVTFSRNSVVFPVCCPSRATYLSGPTSCTGQARPSTRRTSSPIWRWISSIDARRRTSRSSWTSHTWRPTGRDGRHRTGRSTQPTSRGAIARSRSSGRRRFPRNDTRASSPVRRRLGRLRSTRRTCLTSPSSYATHRPCRRRRSTKSTSGIGSGWSRSRLPTRV